MAITDELIAIHEICLAGKYEDVYKKTSALIKSSNRKKSCPPIVYVKRAEAWLSKRRVREAIGDLDRALTLNPELKQAYEWRAECRKMSGDVQGAIKDMEQALALDPLGDAILLNLRPLYLKAGKSKEDYRRVIENNPLSRAIALETAKKNREALTAYNAYIKSHPGNAFGYAYRGNLEYYLKDYKSALTDYEKSLEFNPSGGRELFFVANTLGALGRKKEAIDYYDRMVRVSDNMGFRFKYAKALRDLGEPGKSIDQYSRSSLWEKAMPMLTGDGPTATAKPGSTSALSPTTPGPSNSISTRAPTLTRSEPWCMTSSERKGLPQRIERRQLASPGEPIPRPVAYVILFS